ncbi:MAG: hypothetical protein WCT46_02575 [Candidatus Gracilibacteria bacterium]|jgi:hypothetical protein
MKIIQESDWPFRSSAQKKNLTLAKLLRDSHEEDSGFHMVYRHGRIQYQDLCGRYLGIRKHNTQGLYSHILFGDDLITIRRQLVRGTFVVDMGRERVGYMAETNFNLGRDAYRTVGETYSVEGTSIDIVRALIAEGFRLVIARFEDLTVSFEEEMEIRDLVEK